MAQTANYLEILQSELIPALGCTEPIAVALAAAKAREVLGCFPEKLELHCSGNVVKNVKGVIVPCSCGRKGLDIAGALGAISGDASKGLQVLESTTPDDIQRALRLLSEGFVHCELAEGVENLYIRACACACVHCAEVTIAHKHNCVTRICKDGSVIFHRDAAASSVDKRGMSLRGILDFAGTVPLEQVKSLLDAQIECNSRIAAEGLQAPYGAEVGRTLLKAEGNAVNVRARAYAAAGSDARMGGCTLPVVINSGSGNQGLTVSLPVIEYAKEWKIEKAQLYRALLVSNLLAIHIKQYIGSLSAFCGAVSAACAAGAAITYMAGGSYEQIASTIVNTLGNTSGIVCDGAKASCAAKISSSIEAALLAHHMAMNGRVFPAGDGLVQDDIESTIQNIGYLGRVGMQKTDVTILNLMLGNINLSDG